MIDINLIQKVLLVIVVSLDIILGVVVLLSNKNSIKNRSFFIMSFAVAIWVMSGYLVYYPQFHNYALYFARLNFASVAIWLFAIYIFIRNFPDENKNMSIVDYFYALVGIAFAVLSAFSPMVVLNVEGAGNNTLWLMGSFENGFYAFSVITALLVITILIIKYIKSSKDKKIRLKLMLYGISLLALFNIIFNVIIPTIWPNLNLYWIGDYSFVFFLGFIAYAVVKHQLFDIKVIATEAIVVFLSFILFIQIFISNGATEAVTNVIIWIVATYGGYLLIRSVRHEIKQKEDLAKLAKQLEDANAHLKELDQLKDDFLSMAAHELNTPIAAIEGYLSMILEENIGGEVNPKVRKYLENMFTSSKRLSLLVHDMLNVSRIESGRIHLVYVNTPIEDVINQAIAEIGSKAKERKHTLVFDKSAKKLPITWFDITRITEVLINLIGNAIKYTDPGGRIVVSASADDKYITVAVKDNGRGIAKDKEKAVFEKFTQVDILKDEVKGTGLGMYIAKKFIELHKGKIWFESSISEKDHGTTFYFTLPIIDKKPFDPHEGEGEVLH